MEITRIGGPTVLVELDGWRILVDPTFDAPGRTYRFGLGTSSVKTLPPAVPAGEVGRVDLALVSHDHHADNLDAAGRHLLTQAAAVVTTAAGARRLGLGHATGLRAGESTVVISPHGPPLEITATPCRHGPPLSRPVVGDVVGFALRRAGARSHDLWVTGDTVLYPALLRTARELTVDTAVVNAGGVRFGLTGPVRYSMTGADAVRLVAALRPRVAVPAHYDGWSHFADGPRGMRAAVDQAPGAVRATFRWLADGVPTRV